MRHVRTTTDFTVGKNQRKTRAQHDYRIRQAGWVAGIAPRPLECDRRIHRLESRKTRMRASLRFIRPFTIRDRGNERYGGDTAGLAPREDNKLPRITKDSDEAGNSGGSEERKTDQEYSKTRTKLQDLLLLEVRRN